MHKPTLHYSLSYGQAFPPRKLFVRRKTDWAEFRLADAATAPSALDFRITDSAVIGANPRCTEDVHRRPGSGKISYGEQVGRGNGRRGFSRGFHMAVFLIGRGQPTVAIKPAQS